MLIRPKLVDRLVLNEVVPLFIVMSIVLTTIILVVASADLIKYLTQGVPLWIVLQLIGFNILPWLVATFPMAMLLSSIIAFVRLSTQSEIVALFAAGIPFSRLALPCIAFSAAVTCLALFTNNTIAPYANREFDRLKANLSHELDETTKPFDIPAQYENGKLVLLAHVEGGYDIATRSMRDIYLLQIDPKTGGIDTAIRAKGAQWTGGDNWTLEQPYILAKGMYSQAPSVVIKDLRLLPDTVTFIENGPDEFNFAQLFKQIIEAKASGGGETPEIRYAEVDLWDKISLPFACLVLAIVGVPLGLRPQRNAAMGVAIAIALGIFFAYYALYQYMFVLGQSGHLPPFVAAFLPDVLALGVGIGLLRRSSS
jgi:lipopolysaccharide export system permease protein